jgi:nucleoside-diphosphate-sugar epimerase
LLCYFATPFIATAAKGRFSYPNFQAFCDCYVRGFLDLFETLRKSGPHCRNVLYPSSYFIDELPLNMGEYAAAKAAGESLCRFLEKSHAGVRIHCPRLPRLATDQTATLLPSDTPDPAVAILGILRAILEQGSEAV